MNTFKHVYVKEVVREPRMHFYRVPRLGSFMVVPLEYNSCLSANALDSAVADSATLSKAREEQNKERADWEEEQNKLKEEKERAGEPFEPEFKQWEVLEEKPYLTKKKRYVVCLDTLGQDREFTEDQRRFVLRTIQEFIAIWEEKERTCLRNDIGRRTGQIERLHEFNEQGENAKLLEDEEHFVDEELAKRDPDTSFVDDESKDITSRAARIQFLSTLFKEREDWRKNLLSLQSATVIKMPRLLQSVFYLLQYKREDVCQPGSNKFFWKYARKYFNEEFIDKLIAYTPLGVKTAPQASYTTLNFLEKNLDGLTPEDVEQHCGLEISRIFKWLLLCIKTRKDEIVYRKAQRKRAMLNRDSLIQKE